MVIKCTLILKLSAVPVLSRAITTVAVGEGKGEKRDHNSEYDSNGSKRAKTVQAVSQDFVVPSEEGKY